MTSRELLARRSGPAPLSPNPGNAMGDPTSARTVEMRIEGGAMGGLRSAMLDGKRTGFREMARAGQFWAMAGDVGMPQWPLVAALRGEAMRVRMNYTQCFRILGTCMVSTFWRCRPTALTVR